MLLSGVKVIIYDCDGVLIDSREANQAFYNHLLARFGLPSLTPEQWRRVAPLTAAEALKILFGHTPWLAAAQEYEKTVDNTPFLPLLRVEPQLPEALELLRRHFRLAVASNRGKSLRPVLQHLHLEGYFDLVVSSLEVQEPKPHPESLWKILDTFRVRPREACYLGDSDLDREAAHRAGVIFGAYKNPGLQAHFHVTRHLDLVDLLSHEPQARDKDCG